MHKYIQDNIYKSRLTITYRTFIEGVPVAEELPFRLLVLGDFSGRTIDERKRLDPLARRRIRSLRRDTQFDSLMEDMGIKMPPLPAVRGHREFAPIVVIDFEADLKGQVPEDLVEGKEWVAELVGQGQLRMVAPVMSELDPTQQQLEVTAKVRLQGDEDNRPQVVPGQRITLNFNGRIRGDIPAVFDGKDEIALPEDFQLDNKKHVLTLHVPGTRTVGMRTFKGINDFTPDKLIAAHPELYRVRLVQEFLETLQALILSDEALRGGLRELLKSRLKLYSLWRWFAAECPLLAIRPYSQAQPQPPFVSLFRIEADLPAPIPAGKASNPLPLKVSRLRGKLAILPGKVKLRLKLAAPSSDFAVTFVGPQGKRWTWTPEAAKKASEYEIPLGDELAGTPLTDHWSVEIKNTATDAADGALAISQLSLLVTEDLFGYLPRETPAAGQQHKFTIDVANLLEGTTIEPDRVHLEIEFDKEVENPEIKLSLPPDTLGRLLPSIEVRADADKFTETRLDIAKATATEKLGKRTKPLAGTWTVEINTATDVTVKRLLLMVEVPQPAPAFNQLLETTNRSLPGATPRLLVAQSEIAQTSAQNATLYKFHDREQQIVDADRIANYFAALFANATDAELGKLRIPGHVQALISDKLKEAKQALSYHIDDLYHESQTMKMLEANWRGLHDLWSHIESEKVVIDVLDVTKDELAEDFEESQADIFSGALFKKVYIDEYDRHGGKPFSAMVGLYEFQNSDDDLSWLRVMSKVANASHAPFVASVAPRFFECRTMQEVAEIKKLETVLHHPRYGQWEALRDEDGASYIGLTLPRYMVRKPWKAEDSSRWNKLAHYTELIDENSDYLWGNAAVLFARNMVRSFERSGWCQHIRGSRGGGTISGLPIHTIEGNGAEEIQPPVEIAIPDYRELQFANHGFIALVHRKDTADATFFSARSIKKAKLFQSEIDTQNADLVCNLAYTLSITRIAHYVKRMMREYIGSTADGSYIQKVLDEWLKKYVTTVTNPDDLTLLYYPFKATSVQVTPKPGPLGWYKAVINVLPHVQFEGMDVELRLEAALGGGK